MNEQLYYGFGRQKQSITAELSQICPKRGKHSMKNRINNNDCTRPLNQTKSKREINKIKIVANAEGN